MKVNNGGVHISCLAPALELQPGVHNDVVVNMAPSAEILVARIKSLQPGLRVLVGLWSSDGMKEYLGNVVAAGAAAGIQVRLYKTSDGKQLENALRNYVPSGGAVWIPPDPLLINVENFGIIKRRSAADAIPVYVPTEGLAESGGTASISVSFEEMGRLAAEMARKVLAGESVPAVVYSTYAAVAVNRAAALACGLDGPGPADVKYLEQK
jgi:putative ABC transport system substrate-binding protein